MMKHFGWTAGLMMAASCVLMSQTARADSLAGCNGPRQSSTIALTCNDAILVNTNAEGDSITLFDATQNEPAMLGQITVGDEPSSVAVHPNNTTAYVTNAHDGTVSVVNLATQTVTGTIPVGAEPMGVAVSPNGTRFYVANSGSNNLMVFNTQTLALVATVDLSPFGISPRAIGITNDNDLDDSDEFVLVAMFFAQLRPGMTSVQEGQDDQREGRVVEISVATNGVIGPASLAPMANTGFNANGRLAPGTPGAPTPTPSIPSTNPQTFTTPTGAFPNQLASVAIRPSSLHAYVVSTAASPNGPLRFNHMVQGVVSVFDMVTRAEVTAAQTDPTVRRTAPLNLNQGINLATTPAPRLFMSNPVAMAWRPDGSDAWVVVQNSDLIVRLTVDGGGIPTVGAPLVAGPSGLVRVDLQNQMMLQGPAEVPNGIVINSTGARAFVSNFVGRSITAIDISNATAPAIVATVSSSDFPTPGTEEAIAHLGAALFYTGRGPQGRMSSESWGGCIVCHPNGRADNITWMFDAGPRQTIPLDSTFNKSDPTDQRILNWSAVRDENHDFELNSRGVFGGRGLIDDDRLFLAIGGAGGVTPTDSALIEQFHQATGAVGVTNDLAAGAALPTLAALTSRRDFGVTTLSDGRVYIIGGRAGMGEGALVTGADTVLEFDPRTNAITQRSSAGFTSRHSFGAAAVLTSQGERIYAIGGYASTVSTVNAFNTVEEYNPSTDTWRTVAPLPGGRAQFGITVAGGINTAEPLQLIHVIAGNANSENSPGLDSAVFRFQPDPSGPGTWTVFFPGIVARRNHGAATVLRGVSSRVFIFGGQDAGGNVLDTVQEYNAQGLTAVATPHTSMPAPRARFGISRSLSTNQIYVIGGLDNSGADQTTVFELTVGNNGAVAGPAGTPSGTWVTRGNLSVARRGLGVSSPPGVTNFLPVASEGRDDRQDAIAVWIARNVRTARAPVSASNAAAVQGRALFQMDGLVAPGFSCATCHGGAKWTKSIVDYIAPPSPDVGLGLGDEKIIGAELRQTLTQGPNVLSNVGTFTLAGGRQNELRFNGADIGQAVNPLGANGFNIPSLLSVYETAPYFYNGLAQTFEEMLNGSTDNNGGVRHHFMSDPAQRADMIAFLNSIDERTPTLPCGDPSAGPVTVVHGNGLAGQTRPFSGYVDPRGESNNGVDFNLGISRVVMVFSEPVFPIGDSSGTLSPADFFVEETGGAIPPGVTAINTADNKTVEIVLSRFLTVKEWTTVIANVQDCDGNLIESMGNQGVGVNEPDRVDILFLPGDVNQSSNVSPLDLVRFKQIVNGLFVPPQGALADFADLNRSGTITPLDLIRFKQLVNGISPSTRVWAGQTANHTRP